MVVKSGERLAGVERRGRAAWAETFEPVLLALREGLQERRPQQIAAASGVAWNADEAVFRAPFLDGEFRITWPELVAYPVGIDRPCDTNLQGLFLYYLSTADGTAPAGRWIAFRELPDGWLYHQAFQSYTGDELVRAFGNDVDAFAQAAEAIGGCRGGIGDVGYVFDVLPCLRVAIAYWLGDDEFPPSAQMLFDAAASHYLPTDGLAVLGHRLVHRLLAGHVGRVER